MPSPAPARIFVPMLLAALLGGGVAAGVTAVLVDDDTDTEGHTTTVVAQPPVSSRSGAKDIGQGLTAADIYKRYAPGVVFVKSDIVQRTENPFDLLGGTESSVATGSGFVIDAAGDILTNNHVIDGAKPGRVTVQFADQHTVRAEVVGKDPATDLALLRVDPDGLALKPLPLGSSHDVQVGDPTIAIGNPFGLDRTLTTGVVSALQRRITAPGGFQIDDVIQTDAAINPGNSGGPLIDAAGRVIGINSQIETGGGSASGSIGIGFAVPIDTAKQILKTLKAGQTVERAYLGVQTTTIGPALDALDLPVEKGVLVQTVYAGSPAAAAGLKAGGLKAEIQDRNGDSTPVVLGGDIITRFDGVDVTGQDQLSGLVAGHKPGQKVRIEFVRKGKKASVDVTLGKRPTTLDAEPAPDQLTPSP